MNALREALHRCADILADALEADARESKAPLEERAPVAKARSRRGAALRAIDPASIVVDELSRQRAREIIRRKGI
jgi:hypothetical protein